MSKENEAQKSAQRYSFQRPDDVAWPDEKPVVAKPAKVEAPTPKAATGAEAEKIIKESVARAMKAATGE